jgi:hypothetical protein
MIVVGGERGSAPVKGAATGAARAGTLAMGIGKGYGKRSKLC